MIMSAIFIETFFSTCGPCAPADAVNASESIAMPRNLPVNVMFSSLSLGVQRLLDLPDLVVPVGRQDARRVADGHPSDRHHGARLKPRAQVDRGVHSHFAAPSEHGTVEDRGTGGHEHLVLEIGRASCREKCRSRW